LSREVFLSNKECFNIRFGGKSSIDAELFSKSVNDIINLLKSSANVVNPNCFLDIEIKANKEGSFETIFDVAVSHLPELLDVFSNASNVIQGALSFFLIKQHLKGRKAKKLEAVDGEMAIQNQQDEVLRVPGGIGKVYFENSRVDNLIIKITNNNCDRDFFSIETEGKKVLVDKTQYENMAESLIDENPVAKTIIDKPINHELPLKKPDLLGKSKWEFIYNGRKIDAKINDKIFLTKVRKGQIKDLYAGVRIPSKIQFEYDLDEKGNVVPNSEKYIVIEVTGDVIEPEVDNQIGLFD